MSVLFFKKSPAVFVVVAISLLLQFTEISSENSKMLTLGTEFPDFQANTTHGLINFHEWLGDSWGILFSHPADFTPVCTTELARLIKLQGDFQKRGVKLIALSCDSIDNHTEWSKDIQRYAGEAEGALPYPIIADENRDLAVKLNMLDMDEKNKAGMPLTARAVFIVDSNKKFRLSILYPATTGRNFDEILRVVDALQLTDKHKIATPADWKFGSKVMIQPTVSEDDAKTLFPNATTMNLPSGKPYLRETPQP